MEKTKSFALGTDLGSSSVFVLCSLTLGKFPHISEAVSSFVNWGNSIWLHAPVCTGTHSKDQHNVYCWENLLSCRRGTEQRFKQDSFTVFPFLRRKVLKEAFVVIVAIVYCYYLFLLFSDFLMFWCCEILGCFFSQWGENYVKTPLMWFAFIHISELFRSVVLNPLCTLGSCGEFLRHNDNARTLHKTNYIRISRRWDPGHKTCISDINVSRSWEPLIKSSWEECEVKILRAYLLHSNEKSITVFSYLIPSRFQALCLPHPSLPSFLRFQIFKGFIVKVSVCHMLVCSSKCWGITEDEGEMPRVYEIVL